MGFAAESSVRRSSPATVARRGNPLRKMDRLRLMVVLPPRLLPACVASPGTWPATGSAVARSMDSIRLAPGDPRWRYPEPAISRGNLRAAVLRDCRVVAWPPRRVYRSPARRPFPRFPLPLELCSSKVIDLPYRRRREGVEERSSQPRQSEPERMRPPKPFAIPRKSQVRTRTNGAARRFAPFVPLLRRAHVQSAARTKDYPNNRAALPPRHSATSRREAPPCTTGTKRRAPQGPPTRRVCHLQKFALDRYM